MARGKVRISKAAQSALVDRKFREAVFKMSASASFSEDSQEIKVESDSGSKVYLVSTHQEQMAG